MNDTTLSIRNRRNSTDEGTITRILGNTQAPQVRIAVIAAIYLAYGTVDPHRIPHGSS
jgi:hypothetical protein